MRKPEVSFTDLLFRIHHLLARLALLDSPHGQHRLHAAVGDVGHVDTDTLCLVVVDHPLVVIPEPFKFLSIYISILRFLLKPDNGIYEVL